MPDEDSAWRVTFDVVEILLTILFGMELLGHLFAYSHNLREYFASRSNCFDFIVVIISILALIFKSYDEDNGMPPVKMFRLVRVVRVMRLMKHCQSLNALMAALSSSLWPILNSLTLLLIFTAMYASFATHLFGSASDELFGRFSASFFTMIQVAWLSCHSTSFRAAYARARAHTHTHTHTHTHRSGSRRAMHVLAVPPSN